MKKVKYRIVTDDWGGYEAQYKLWWWPFWLQLFWTNTSSTIEGAEREIELSKLTGRLRRRYPKFKSTVVK